MGSHVNHGCDMRIWAMLEHRPGGPPAAAEPAWFREFGGEYKTDATLYAVVKRGYQGCLTLRGALPLKGWQTWAWGTEPPVIHPGPCHASGTQAWGFDSATVPVSKAAASGVWADRQWRAGEPASYSFRQEGLWTHCVFTPCATLVLLAGDLGRRRTTWCVNLATSPAPRLEDHAVRLGELRGRLHFEGAPPQFEEPPEGGVALLHFLRDEVVSAFAFSEGSWQWLPPGAATRRWHDASGTYAVHLTGGERPDFTVTREETP
jgi:hypothetical protein